MPIAKIEIDEHLIKDASEARRAEWNALIKEVVATQELSAAAGASVTLRIIVTEPMWVLELHGPDGQVEVRCEVPRDALSKHVAEYVDIVRQMSADGVGASSSRMEALDMAKKVTHDDAGRKLQRLVRPLGADHETCRRLFSLMLALRIDTTKLLGIHGHRPIR
jgi:uncharacterized protein (UPF0262 family)